jgi:Icc-related predicted phosphoesterase
MKFLCVSDQIDPLVYAASMKERFKDVDVVFSAGDLPPEYLGYIVTLLNKPLYYVAGNHDAVGPARPDRAFSLAYLRPADEVYTGAIDAAGKVLSEQRLLIAGLPGCMRYNHGPVQYTDFEMWLMALALVPRLIFNKLKYGRYLDVLLTHAPPRGIHDRQDLCHRGFKAFLWLMRAFKPRFLIHGHIHLYDMNEVRVSSFGQTSVVNAFGHCVLSMESP